MLHLGCRDVSFNAVADDVPLPPLSATYGLDNSAWARESCIRVTTGFGMSDRNRLSCLRAARLRNHSKRLHKPIINELSPLRPRRATQRLPRSPRMWAHKTKSKERLGTRMKRSKSGDLSSLTRPRTLLHIGCSEVPPVYSGSWCLEA
jgi:hypothetical protein